MGLTIFDSSIFDESLRDPARQKADATEAQSLYVMNNFYVPLIKSGQIDSLRMSAHIDGSVGAQIARDVALLSLAAPLPIRELKENFFPKRRERTVGTREAYSRGDQVIGPVFFLKQVGHENSKMIDENGGSDSRVGRRNIAHPRHGGAQCRKPQIRIARVPHLARPIAAGRASSVLMETASQWMP